MAQSDVKYKFVGPRGSGGLVHRFLAGIPARDLTQADMDKLPPDQRKRVGASSLYEPVRAKKADDEDKPKARAKPEEPEKEPEAEAGNDIDPAEEAAV